MSLYERHIFKRVGLSFLFVLGSLTGVVWVTQALRRLDLVTVKGQTVWLFAEMTVMALPSLVIVITPFAILFALVSTLTVLHSDSELVVINSTGGSRLIVLRPILIFVLIAAMIMAAMTIYLAPLAKRHLRNLITEVRADFIASVVVPGRFSSVESGLTIHIRDRESDGSLVGLLLHDEREANVATTIFAKQGRVEEAGDLSLLALSEGSIHRNKSGERQTSIVEFDRYFLDLSSLTKPGEAKSAVKPSERTTIELLNLDATEWYVEARYGRFVAELHERFAQPLYPIAFGLVVLLFLGDPRTNRQGRTMAVAGAIVGCVAVRTVGFILNSIVLTTPISSPNLIPVLLLYLFPLFVIFGSLTVILSGKTLSAPAFVFDYGERVVQMARSLTTTLARKRGVGVQTS